MSRQSRPGIQDDLCDTRQKLKALSSDKILIWEPKQHSHFNSFKDTMWLSSCLIEDQGRHWCPLLTLSFARDLSFKSIRSTRLGSLSIKSFLSSEQFNIDPVCLCWMITIRNVTAPTARSGCILVPSEWKLSGKRPFPGGSSVSHRQPRHIKRQSLFVQVFRIGPAPDIFLNKTKWRTIFRNHNLFPSLKIPVRFQGLQTLASLLRNPTAGTTVLHLCPSYKSKVSLPGCYVCKHECIVNLSVMDIYDGASSAAMTFFMQPAKEAPTSRPPAPRFIWNFNT